MENSQKNWSDFEREWTQRTISSINHIRSAAGLTVKELAHRLRALGWPVSNATLSGMLSAGKRSSLSIAEITAFARVLNVSPLYFILGLPQSNALPDGSIWTNETPSTSRIADWYANNLAFKPFLTEELPGFSDSGVLATSDKAWDGLSEIFLMSHTRREIEKRAATLVVLDHFNSEILNNAHSEHVKNQGYLWDALETLSKARKIQLEQEEPWSTPPEPLPDELKFVDNISPRERRIFTVDELESFTNDNELTKTDKRLSELFSHLEANMPEDTGDGHG